MCFPLSDVTLNDSLSTSLQMGLSFLFYDLVIFSNINEIFFIHSTVNGHLGCLHVLALVNSAGMNN